MKYGFTEGLDIYSASYTIPWNAYDGTFSLSYDNSNSGIIEEEFSDLDIESDIETYGFNLRHKKMAFMFLLSISLFNRLRKNAIAILI
ncbi:MAG: hypothetical protein AAF383_08935 [Cyanobacteria bacterium P01_A01_bin.83]